MPGLIVQHWDGRLDISLTLQKQQTTLTVVQSQNVSFTVLKLHINHLEALHVLLDCVSSVPPLLAALAAHWSRKIKMVMRETVSSSK